MNQKKVPFQDADFEDDPHKSNVNHNADRPVPEPVLEPRAQQSINEPDPGHKPFKAPPTKEGPDVRGPQQQAPDAHAEHPADDDDDDDDDHRGQGTKKPIKGKR